MLRKQLIDGTLKCGSRREKWNVEFPSCPVEVFRELGLRLIEYGRSAGNEDATERARDPANLHRDRPTIFELEQQ